jgi:PGF-pre-PGF domain-containing protein
MIGTKKIYIWFSLLVFLLLTTNVRAVPVDWYGTVTIDGSSSTDGAIVEAFINGSTTSVASDVVGTPDSGYYLIHVPCSPGDNVTFKVYGVTVNEGVQTCSGMSNYLNLTMNKAADGTTCTYAQGCSGGYCVHGYCRSSSTYCGDGYCDTGESCSSDDSACPTGYACTNGCVLVSGVSTGVGITVTEESKTILSITAGESDTIKFTKNVDIQEITITVKNDVQNVEISVKKESSKPSEVTTPPGVAYSYLTITTSNIESDDISDVKIKFKVGKPWITENNINKDTIKLYRYTTEWNELQTSLVSEDENYVYYEAISPGLSVFAISGEKISEACAPGEKRCSGNELQQCKPDGSGWIALETCTYGCDPSTLKCRTQACIPNEMKCVGNVLEQCKSDGSEWVIVEKCQYGCSEGKCLSPVTTTKYFWIALFIILAIIVVIIYLRKK